MHCSRVNRNVRHDSYQRVLESLSTAADQAAAYGHPDFSERILETVGWVRGRCSEADDLVSCLTEGVFETGFARGARLLHCAEVAKRILLLAIPEMTEEDAQRAIAKIRPGAKGLGHRAHHG